MTKPMTLDAYGKLIEPATLKIERLLPGPIERVWSYLTESDKRRKWLAAGDMELKVGAPFELVWRNNELTDPPGKRPDGFGDEHRMQSRIIELDPPHKLAFAWGEKQTGKVAITLQTKGSDVLLTLIHERLPDDRAIRLRIQAGWHGHLDMLVARISGTNPQPYWDTWTRLQKEYEARS
jgi:uncharacterized protein YndB with AHSA1/START domain